jgi:cathepsin C
LCLVFFSGVRADIPVHCLKHQVTGEWIFEKDEPQSWDGHPQHHTCGHALPDNPATSNIEMRTFKKNSEMTVNLFSDHIAKEVNNADGTEGSWTMIYDEGFDV